MNEMFKYLLLIRVSLDDHFILWNFEVVLHFSLLETRKLFRNADIAGVLKLIHVARSAKYSLICPAVMAGLLLVKGVCFHQQE